MPQWSRETETMTTQNDLLTCTSPSPQNLCMQWSRVFSGDNMKNNKNKQKYMHATMPIILTPLTHSSAQLSTSTTESLVAIVTQPRVHSNTCNIASYTLLQ